MNENGITVLSLFDGMLCSDSQAYRMLGNGWTVEVIKHIFSFLPEAWKA